MKQITKQTAGRQIVVFDHVVATRPAGVLINAVEAKKRFTDGIIPAGTLLIPHNDESFKPVNDTFTDSNIATAIGLTAEDIVLDDFPMVAVVISGTARTEALPDKEKAGIAFVKKVLPRITFY
ncbi:hypothetical protein [Capnocytophaga leadbetteri]|jgi:hypothetical protein|uniref:hypothetical protein n=1 Tax=Capnocytophaga leadbetteri TaxID=327575 RepID=UPI0020451833|nr:hypothetical protein [Capnocytophaga leadbetteri]DAN70636.1 MAG TPA: hypothetical protein [Caudoviricetes sp.]DAR32342.1 MAG TPA: hypothetical protein [Caudoviricetes sp.]